MDRRSYTIELITVGVLLFLGLLCFFGKALQPGHILSAADRVFISPYFSDYAPEGFVRPSNQLLYDQAYQFTPWRWFSWTSIRSGELPAWNPYSYCGTPMIATMQSAVFYPINFILSALPFESGFVWGAIIKLWVAGIFTWLLCRQLGLDFVPSLLASIAFMLCGFLVSWLGHPHTNVAVWLPALMLCAEMLLKSEGRRRRLFLAAGMALLVGIQITGGHIETSVDILFGVGLFTLVRWIQLIFPRNLPLKTKLQPLGLFILAGILGAAIAAVQLLPFVEWLPLSAEFHARSARQFLLFNPESWRHLLSLPVIIFPNIYNNPTWDYLYWSFLLNWSNQLSLVTYFGTLPLILAVTAMFYWFKKGNLIVNAWMWVALICFGRAFSIPGFDIINQLPLLNLGTPERLRLVFTFSLCILAGFGAQLILSPDPTMQNYARRLARRLCLTIVAAGLLLMVSANLVIPLVRDRVVEFGQQMVIAEYANRATHSNPLEYYLDQVNEMVSGLEAAFKPQSWQMYTPVFWALLAYLAFTKIPNRWFSSSSLLYILPGLAFIDLFAFGFAYNPTIKQEYHYPVTALTQEIKNDPGMFRVLSLRQDLIPDAHIMLGLSEIRGLDFQTYWYDAYMFLVPDRLPFINYGMIFGSHRSALLQMLNLKYVAAVDPDAFKDDHAVDVKQFGNMYLAALKEVRPRAWLAKSVVAVSSDEQAKEFLQNLTFENMDQIVVTQTSAQPAIEAIQITAPLVSSVTSVQYKPSYSAWRVVSSHPTMLFVSDAYYPGWVAQVDDAEVEIYRSNLAFRAVPVPAGEHTVTFSYEPISIRLGIWISWGSLGIVLMLVLLGWRSGRRDVAPG